MFVEGVNFSDGQLSYEGSGRLSQDAWQEVSEEAREEFSDLSPSDLQATLDMIGDRLESVFSKLNDTSFVSESSGSEIRARVVEANFLLIRRMQAEKAKRSIALGVDPSEDESPLSDLSGSELHRYGTMRHVQERRRAIRREVDLSDTVPEELKNQLADQHTTSTDTIEKDLAKLRKEFGS